MKFRKFANVAGLVLAGGMLCASVQAATTYPSISYTDRWDVSQGASISGSDALYAWSGWYSDVRNAFGGTFGAGPNDLTYNTIFKDAADGFVHWTEVQTPAAFELKSINLFAAHDGTSINRSISAFRLFAWDAGAGAFTLIYQLLPDFPYAAGPSDSQLFVTADMTTLVTTDRWRMEYVQQGPLGPRIYELDGYDSYQTVVPVPATLPLLLSAVGLIALRVRRRSAD